MSHPDSGKFEMGPYPDLDELNQMETNEMPTAQVPVIVDEIRDQLRAILVPNRDVVISSVVVAAGDPIHVINDDDRRAKITLSFTVATGGVGGNIRIGRSAEEITGGGGGIWPVRPPGSAPSAPIIINSGKGVWAKLDTGDTNVVTVTYIAEYWAD